MQQENSLPSEQNSDMNSPTTVTSPQFKSILNDRVKCFNLEAIVNAKTPEDIRLALCDAVAALDILFRKMTLEDIQNEAKQLLHDPHNEELIHSLNDKFISFQRNTYVRNGQYLHDSVHYMDIEYVSGVRNDLINEYKASSLSDLLLIDVVTNAYFGYMRASRALKSFIEDNDGRREYASQTWINMLKELTKVVDMANRQFTTALANLKGLRQPPITVTVQTKEAFIGQNQQINKNP